MRVLEKKFIVKDRGVLGPKSSDKEYMVCLNRTLRWRRAGADGGEAILYEADARHGELLRAQMGLEPNSRGLSAPGVAIKITPDVEKPLDEEHAARYTITAPRLVWKRKRQQWPTWLLMVLAFCQLLPVQGDDSQNLDKELDNAPWWMLAAILSAVAVACLACGCWGGWRLGLWWTSKRVRTKAAGMMPDQPLLLNRMVPAALPKSTFVAVRSVTNIAPSDRQCFHTTRTCRGLSSAGSVKELVACSICGGP